MTSSIAGIGVTGSSMAYSVSKAAGNSIDTLINSNLIFARPSIDEMSCGNTRPQSSG